ncbi:MAG: hypothetical protein NXH81_11950 [Halieaceae bacterium]|jgi:hypothetical protein|uniref:hypothetical protein n=1 Tax=Haliea alexandrii TaxID=2448162 RepID=UPI001304BBF0|nr:hypothetical protein [Haliea alexandrii]MCR9186100.1 hypothetical protein [Halieaceae bacterium]
MRDPALEKKLRDYRFEQLELRHSIRLLFQGSVVLVSLVALLVALFHEHWPMAVFLALAAAGLALVSGISALFSRRCALADLQRELSPGETYEPPRSVL